MKKTYFKDLSDEQIIENLKNEMVVKSDEDNYEYKLVDGTLCEFDEGKLTFYNAGLNLNYIDYYFEEPEVLELEVGELYKTRDGRKAFVGKMRGDVGVLEGFVENDDTHSWNKDGRSYFFNKDLDLVEKWEKD